ncbi:uncharacterized protein PG998_006318 [Apiospora kogelbergensis]|uniref:uncharacterized protein n=1 Tax=Apiospora kogelbergensis TaxID=1337665 RepID=UPI0031300890
MFTLKILSLLIEVSKLQVAFASWAKLTFKGHHVPNLERLCVADLVRLPALHVALVPAADHLLRVAVEVVEPDDHVAVVHGAGAADLHAAVVLDDVAVAAGARRPCVQPFARAPLADGLVDGAHRRQRLGDHDVESRRD